MDDKRPAPQNYAQLLESIKERIKTAQVRAALAAARVNDFETAGKGI